MTTNTLKDLQELGINSRFLIDMLVSVSKQK